MKLLFSDYSSFVSLYFSYGWYASISGCHWASGVMETSVNHSGCSRKAMVLLVAKYWPCVTTAYVAVNRSRQDPILPVGSFERVIHGGGGCLFSWS